MQLDAVSIAFATSLPKNLALIDDDKAYSDGLSKYLREHGIDVSTFADSNDLLASGTPYAYEFYVTDLMLPGIEGTDLIDILRKRTNAGVVVVSGRLAADTFKEVIEAGADMYLTKPVQFEQIELAIKAVLRRTNTANPSQNIWRLDCQAGRLVAPDGVCVDLSEADCTLLESFAEANGEVVPRETLLQRLGRDSDTAASGGLNAIVFRLRRRIERATPVAVPLQTKSGVGYVFRAPLKII